MRKTIGIAQNILAGEQRKLVSYIRSRWEWPFRVCSRSKSRLHGAHKSIDVTPTMLSLLTSCLNLNSHLKFLYQALMNIRISYVGGPNALTCDHSLANFRRRTGAPEAREALVADDIAREPHQDRGADRSARPVSDFPVGGGGGAEGAVRADPRTNYPAHAAVRHGIVVDGEFFRAPGHLARAAYA